MQTLYQKKTDRGPSLFILGAILLSLLLTAKAGGTPLTDYKLGGGDVIRVTVYDHPDLTSTIRVTSDGTITFPLIGQIEVEGMPVTQVADKISTLLADGYIINPQVSLFIEDFRSKKAVIMGQVNRPGLYELSGPTTLLELISQAGGLTRDAGNSVTIKRKASDSEKESVFAVDLKDLMEGGEMARDVPILDGDNLFVAKAGIFYITGEVSKPDSYTLEKGTTLIKAISIAGGFSKLAAKGKVRIIRKIDGKEHFLKNAHMDEPILPNDVIVVPESFF